MSRWSALRRRTRIVGVLVVFALVGGVASLAYARMNDLPDDAAFRLEGRTVTVEALEDRVGVLVALYNLDRPASGEAADAFDRTAAKSLAVSLILENEASDRDITIADKAAQTQLDALVEAQLQGGGRQAFVDFLSASGISERDVLDEIKRQLATSRLVEEVTGDVAEPTDEEVRAAFSDYQESLVSPEGRRVLNIVLGSRLEAVRVARLARGGKSFMALAKTYSMDGATRDQGGDLGVVAQDQLDPAYGEVAFAVEKDGIFGPVKTEYGWNVGKVIAIQPARELPYDEVQSQLRAELLNRDRLEVWREFLADLLTDADVEYAPAYLPDDPTSPPEGLPE